MAKTNKEKRRIIGLDCHPDTFVAADVTGSRPEDAHINKVTHSIALSQLESWFSRNAQDIDVVLLEASANSFAIFDRLTQAGYEVLVLESETVARLSDELNETDRTSATRLARVYLSGLTDEVWVPDLVTRDRRKVLSCYGQARKDLTRTNNRIKSMLNEHTVRLPKGTKLTTEKGRAAVFASRSWNNVQHELLSEAFQDLSRAAAKVRKFRKLMAAEILRDPAMLSLVRIYGLRHITVFSLVAMIGAVKRFPSPKKLAAYLGVTPKRKSSGSTVRKNKKGRCGRGDLRPLLVQAAHVIFHHKSIANPLYSWALRLRFRRGRERAVIAVARKIATAVWYVLNGRAIPAEKAEEHATLYNKLYGLLKELGAATVRRMGYKTYDECIAEKMKILLGNA